MSINRQRCDRCGRFFKSPCPYDEYCRPCETTVQLEKEDRRKRDREFERIMERNREHEADD